MDADNANILEDRRQLEHLLPIGFAFLLPYISYGTALLLAVVAVVHALYISPRWVRVTTRHDEKRLGFSIGKSLYALSILGLLLAFPGQLYIVAGVWAILAVGDSLSNVVGRRWGQTKLPYNPIKSTTGLLTFWISGTLASWILLSWNLPSGSQYTSGVLLLFAVISTSLAALAESLPSTIDDNLIITWIASVSYVLLFSIENTYPQLSGYWFEALLINLAAALLATFLRWISWKGTVLASLFGFFVYIAMGWQAYALLCVFLILGSLATRMGKKRKEMLRIAEGEHGRRGVSNVLCNGIVPILIALFSLWIKSPVLAVAFAAAVATATLDTVSTEIGQWLGRKPVNPITFRPVRVGTPGGVSWEGTGAGVLAAALVGLISFWTAWLPLSAAPVIVVGALSGGTAESVLASVLKRKPEYSGSTLNLFNTLLGAFVSAMIWLNV